MFEHMVPFLLHPSQGSRQMAEHWPGMSGKLGECVQDWLKTHFGLYVSDFEKTMKYNQHIPPNLRQLYKLKWPQSEFRSASRTWLVECKTFQSQRFLYVPTGFTFKTSTRVGTLLVATIYLQLIQNRYMFRSFTVLQCSHQHCVQPVASDVEVVGYL